MSKSREKTAEEIKAEFLNHIRYLVKYWNDAPDRDCEGKLNGLAFSILGAIDGVTVGLPGFILAPLVHEDDKEYDIERGNDYYPENHDSDVKCDISGDLHDSFYE